MRKRAFAALLAVLGVALAGGPAFAQVPAESAAIPMGGTDVDERIRERDRMRMEYEEMRDARAMALEEARQETAGTSGEQIPGWKGTGARGGGRTLPNGAGGANAGDGAKVDKSKVAGARRYIIFILFASLGVLIFLRFRKAR